MSNVMLKESNGMNRSEYEKYVLSECERQWNDCQHKNGEAEWKELSEKERNDFYDDMYNLLVDEFTKCCVDCRYFSLGNCTKHNISVKDKNYCVDFAE